MAGSCSRISFAPRDVPVLPYHLVPTAASSVPNQLSKISNTQHTTLNNALIIIIQIKQHPRPCQRAD